MSNINTDLASFKSSVETTLSGYEETINNAISSKNSEVDSALSNLNVQNEIETYFNNQVTSGYFDTYFNTRYANVYVLTGYQASQPTPTPNSYYYNTQTNKLYYSQYNRWALATVDVGGLYIYNGNLYMGKNDNGNLILEAINV